MEQEQERLTRERLRARRLALDVSQAVLADWLGVRRNTIVRWERGLLKMRNPRLIDMGLSRLEVQRAARGIGGEHRRRRASSAWDRRKRRAAA